MSEAATHNGACHCRTVKFRVRLTNEFHTIRRCTCSYCRMRGAVAASAPIDGFELIEGAESLTLYQFNTRAAKHYFCRTCGIYTHHQRRSDPTQFGVNVACLEGVSPFDFPEVIVVDGVSHPSDGASGSGVVGVLRFVPS